MNVIRKIGKYHLYTVTYKYQKNLEWGNDQMIIAPFCR